MIMHSNRGILCALLCALTLISLGAAPLRAQDAQERASAAEAYDRGTSAYLAENFAAAARWFETAHRMAPAAPALIQAVRAHQRAGHGLRAATLALRLHLLYPDDERAQGAASPVLEAAAESYVRVEASCEDCTLELDGTLLVSPAFFVDPGGDHALIAHFSTGEREETLRGSAGDVLTPSFEAPTPREPVAGSGPLSGGAGPADSTDPGSSGGGLPAGVFITSLVLTVGAGATLAWSGLDTNSDADSYEASIAAGDFETARRQLAKGRDEERRTNILIGVTAGLGLTTALIAAFTDWGGSDEAEPDTSTAITGAGVSALPGGGAVAVEGRF
jgi:hypothetical protein